MALLLLLLLPTDFQSSVCTFGVLFPQGCNYNKGHTSVRTTAPQKHKGEDPGTEGQCRASNPRFHTQPLTKVSAEL